MNMASNLSKRTQLFRSRIARLKSDVSGNVLPMMGAAIFPLIGMIGGGIDASRIYMAKTRLQYACDAGALTGRKVMAANAFSSAPAAGQKTAKEQADAFFNANFKTGDFGTENVSVAYTEVDDQVSGVASATVPMMVMKVFGYEQVPITASCRAELSLANTDVMFALDTTGSMVQSINGTPKIESLREAVVEFDQVMRDSLPTNAQMRLGFVPFAMNVNVGHILYEENPNWLVTDTWTYQSRKYYPRNETGVRTPLTWGNPSSTALGTSGSSYNSYNGSWTNVLGSSIQVQSVNYSTLPSGVTTQAACNALADPVSVSAPAGSPTNTTTGSVVNAATGVRTVTVTQTQNYSRTDYNYEWVANATGSGSTTPVEYNNINTAHDHMQLLGIYNPKYFPNNDDEDQPSRNFLRTRTVNWGINSVNVTENGNVGALSWKIANWLINKQLAGSNNNNNNVAAIMTIMTNFASANGITTTNQLTDSHRATVAGLISTYIDENGAAAQNVCRLKTRVVTHSVDTPGTYTEQPLTWTEPEVTPEKWVYGPTSYPVANYVKGEAVNVPVGNGGSLVSTTWKGCIEERDTVAASTFAPLSASAFDLNIGMEPNSRETRWRPYWPEVVFRRTTVDPITYTENLNSLISNYDTRNPQTGCPSEAQKLAVMDQSQVQNYVDGLVPDGGTYHDIGMIWAARFLSPTGLFADENNMTQFGEPISRHIIYMTDGLLDTGDTIYTSWGMEKFDKRITAGNLSDQWNRHQARFLAACDAARNQGMTIWVIGFGITMPDSMYTCADDDPANKAAASHTFQADDDEDLKDTFKEVAAKIARLRVGA
jgi:Flp pilus assembly protein TadG